MRDKKTVSLIDDLRKQTQEMKLQEEERIKQDEVKRAQLIQQHNNQVLTIQKQMQELQNYMNNQKLDEQKFNSLMQQLQEERQIQMDSMQDKHNRE